MSSNMTPYVNHVCIIIICDKTVHRVTRENPVQRMEGQQHNTLGTVSSNKLIILAQAW